MIKLECGKLAGPDGVYAESIKFALPRLHVFLSICFGLCFTQGYMPADMMKTTIVPIIKNKCGNLADSNNYRPIVIAIIVSKLFESIFLYKCEEFLYTCDTQFGFKPKHSTELCILYTKGRGVCRISQGGGGPTLKFLGFWICGMSRAAKLRAFARGVLGHAPPRNFLKMVQFRAF